MKHSKRIGAFLAVGAVALALAACQKKEETSGAAQEMGQHIDSVMERATEQTNAAASKAQEQADEAAQKLSQALETAKVKAKEMAQQAGKQIESAGQQMQEASKKEPE